MASDGFFWYSIIYSFIPPFPLFWICFDVFLNLFWICWIVPDAIMYVTAIVKPITT